MATNFKVLVEHGPKTVTGTQVNDVLERLGLPPSLNVMSFDQLVVGNVKDPKTGTEQVLVKAREWKFLSLDELEKATKAGAAPSVYGVVEVPDDEEAEMTPEPEPPKSEEPEEPPTSEELHKMVERIRQKQTQRMVACLDETAPDPLKKVTEPEFEDGLLVFRAP